MGFIKKCLFISLFIIFSLFFVQCNGIDKEQLVEKKDDNKKKKQYKEESIKPEILYSLEENLNEDEIKEAIRWIYDGEMKLFIENEEYVINENNELSDFSFEIIDTENSKSKTLIFTEANKLFCVQYDKKINLIYSKDKIESYLLYDEDLDGFKELWVKEKEVIDDNKERHQYSSINEIRNNKIFLQEKYNLLEYNKTKPIFISNPLSKEEKDYVTGVSWSEGAPVSLEDLSMLTLSYWGFDERNHIGKLLVHKSVADEVIEIFKEIYSKKYFIQDMTLIYDKLLTMEQEDADFVTRFYNNTGCYYYRKMVGKNSLSKHAYGLAIDINPIQNPYVKDKKVIPSIGEKFVNRDQILKGMIKKEDALYEAFISKGWIWGGDWESPKDYMHFEKP